MKILVAYIACFFSFTAFAKEVSHELGSANFEYTPVRVVTLDWALTETVLSLGIEPIGVADIKGYNSWVAEPEVGDAAIDVGSRREPNFESLLKLNPDVILISKQMSAAYPQLNSIAPTLAYSIYNSNKSPFDSAVSITRDLGDLLDKSTQAERIISDTQNKLLTNGQKIKEQSANGTQPLLFVRFVDEKTVRIHSDGSLANDTIEKMGLTNSWQEPTNLWGFTTAGIEKVAEHQKTNLMIFGPLKEIERKQLLQSPLWQAMEFTRNDSVYELPAIWTFGGLIASQRFSDQITSQLTNQSNK